MLRTMFRAPAGPTSLVIGSLGIAVSLAGVAGGMTLLFLAMRSVMAVGGACADGGPYVSAQPCPDGVPLGMLGGIFGGLASLGAYVYFTIRHGVPTLLWLAWPALFLSLGWNFLEFGLDAPGEQGLEWGWLVCAVLFIAMGGGPLLLFGKPIFAALLGRSSGSPGERPAGPRPFRPPVILVEPDTSSPRDGDLVGALERLAALHRAGQLTDDEFASAKDRILGGDS